MKYIYLVLLLTIFSCNEKSKKNDLKKSSKINQETKGNNDKNKREQVLNYVKRRNSNIEYFKNREFNDRTYKQVNDSLFALEKLLKSILIPTKLKDINKTGKINLETFLPELGFGMLDGLTTYEKGISALCTTSFIFSDYFKKQGYKFHNISESEIEDICASAFASDYVITNIHSFKINNIENIKAYGMVSIDGHEIGSFSTPNTLYLLAIIDDNIYLSQKTIKNKLQQIEKCKEAWENTDYHSMESFDKSRENYCDCYKKEFINNEQFPILRKEIEEMLKLITK